MKKVIELLPYLVRVDDLELLENAVGMLRGDERSKREDLLFIEEDV